MFRSTSVDMPGTVPVQLYCQMRKSSGAVGVGTLYSASHAVTLERNSSASLNRVSSETLRRKRGGWQGPGGAATDGRQDALRALCLIGKVRCLMKIA